jgi:hypothetical protein
VEGKEQPVDNKLLETIDEMLFRVAKGDIEQNYQNLDTLEQRIRLLLVRLLKRRLRTASKNAHTNANTNAHTNANTNAHKNAHTNGQLEDYARGRVTMAAIQKELKKKKTNFPSFDSVSSTLNYQGFANRRWN